MSYNEFCELCEEKRRGIDPFENQKSLMKPEIDKESVYFANIDLDTLDHMSRRLKPLSTSKNRLKHQSRSNLNRLNLMNQLSPLKAPSSVNEGNNTNDATLPGRDLVSFGV